MILLPLNVILLVHYVSALSTENTYSSGPNSYGDIEAISPSNHYYINETDNSAETNGVNSTIEEVEQILADNPDLPQLSREEIMEILNNITSEDHTTEQAITESDETTQTSNEDYLRRMRALMLVLPFNAKNLTESMIKELYTKVPVTRLVSGAPYEEVTTRNRTSLTTTKQPIITVTWTEEPKLVQEFQTSNHHNTYHEPFTLQHRNPAATTTTTTTTTTSTTTIKTDTETEVTLKQSSEHQKRPNQNRWQHPPIATDIPEVHSEPSKRFKDGERKPTVQQQQLTTIYPEKTSIYYLDNQPNNQQEVHSPAATSAPPNKHSNNSHHLLRKRKRTTTPAPTTIAIKLSAAIHIPTTKYTLAKDPPSGIKQPIENANVYDYTKVPELNAALFVTPSVEIMHNIDSPEKYSSQHHNNKPSPQPIPAVEPTMSDDIQEILASIGLYPEKDKASENSSAQLQAMKIITMETTTTTTALPDIAAAAESLTPEMKDLLKSFGLLPSENDIQPPSAPDLVAEPSGEAYNPKPSPVVDPSSYLSFKPLPLTSNANSGPEENSYTVSSDMKQFLASFGLVPDTPGSFRSQKSLEKEPKNDTINNQSKRSSEKSDQIVPQINLEMLNQDMKDVLASLGFISGNNSTKIKRKSTNSPHIFNPSAHLASLQPTDEETRRLTKLLETVKKIVKENATLSQEEIEMLNTSIAFILPPLQENSSTQKGSLTSENSVPRFVPKKENKITTLDQVKSAPDPLSLDELLLNADGQKNEVKRQQSNNETSTSTTESAITTTMTNAGPSFTDLAESFGGGETASSDADIDDNLPPRKPNGLYFLLDWNTFLDVGVEGERRINLRFTPKLGNPRAFIPVTIP